MPFRGLFAPDPDLKRERISGLLANTLIFLKRTSASGGAEGNRTPDLLIANEALSQLSYSPTA
ncbi:hypothetical protein AA13595_0925 [Gluconacetobacter johannae DSM 13595]|nr:hypothetical protein AA13595_0925 [Gluconacetobacter johannae DSM 13595]